MDAKTLRAALDLARRSGAKAAEVYLETTTALEVESLRGKVSVREGRDPGRLVVRAWLDAGRAGVAEGPPSASAALAAEAVRRAEAAPEDPHAAPAVRQVGVLGGLGILDRRWDQIEPEDRAEIVAGAERELRAADRRLQSAVFRYRERRVVRAYASTRGTVLEEASSVFTVVGRATAPAERGDLVLDAELSSRSFATAASFPHGADLARRAAELLRPAVALSGPVRVVLPPLAVAHLFAWVAATFSPELRRPGAPSFLAPRDGRSPVLDRRIHLQDDGTLPGGLRTSSFDERGVAPVPVVLVREGRPEGPLLDPETARRLGTSPTGHVGSRGLCPTNLLLRAGTRSVNAALAEHGGRVLAVDDLDLSGADLATGRLDAVVHGAVLDGPRPVGAARHLRLRGSLGEVLSRVVEVCSDTDRIGHVDAPAMIVDGFEVR